MESAAIMRICSINSIAAASAPLASTCCHRSFANRSGWGSVLEAMANGSAGRFVFESTRLHPDYDAGSPLVHQTRRARCADAASNDPKVALLLPYGEAMASFSAITGITRDQDGVCAIFLRRNGRRSGHAGAAAAPRSGRDAADAPAIVRVGAANWRHDSRLPRISAADL